MKQKVIIVAAFIGLVGGVNVLLPGQPAAALTGAASGVKCTDTSSGSCEANRTLCNHHWSSLGAGFRNGTCRDAGYTYDLDATHTPEGDPCNGSPATCNPPTTNTDAEDEEEPKCVGEDCCGGEKGVKTSIITMDEICGKQSGDGVIFALLKWVLRIMTAGVGIAAVGGIAYGALLYTSAENKPEQTKKAIGIITNVVIGIVAYALMAVFLNFLIPGGILG